MGSERKTISVATWMTARWQVLAAALSGVFGGRQLLTTAELSASSRHEAIAAELSAAATQPLELQAGRAPEWITLIPAGTFSLVDGRGPFHNFNADAVISASLARSGTVDLAGDYDHHMDAPPEAGVKGLASGWIRELKNQGGAVMARVEWTSAARQHIENREYRYVSPRFAYDAGHNVLALVRFGLTNKPAITDLPAIAAAQADHRQPSEENDVNLLQRLIGVLAISASATEDQLVEIVRGLTANANAITKAAGVTSAAAAEDVITALRAKAVEGYVSASDHKKVVDERDRLVAEQQTAAKDRLTREISAAVEDGVKQGKIVPAGKQTWIDLCTQAGSVDPVSNFLKTAPVVLKPGVASASATPSTGSLDVEDAQAISAAAADYIAEQAKRDIVVSAAEAVTHVLKQNGNQGA
ncbi:MAG: phage protease [Proteobacteria bacterium]|nr:phage protease [Pseudomonadota bacterium]